MCARGHPEVLKACGDQGQSCNGSREAQTSGRVGASPQARAGPHRQGVGGTKATTGTSLEPEMPGTHPMSGTALVSGRPGGVGEREALN